MIIGNPLEKGKYRKAVVSGLVLDGKTKTPVPGAQVFCEALSKATSSDQYSIGFFKNFNNNTFETSLEMYYKDIRNEVDYKNGARLMLNDDLCDEGKVITSRIMPKIFWGFFLVIQNSNFQVNCFEPLKGKAYASQNDRIIVIFFPISCCRCTSRITFHFVLSGRIVYIWGLF